MIGKAARLDVMAFHCMISPMRAIGAASCLLKSRCGS
jgi:hypothetical protein